MTSKEPKELLSNPEGECGRVWVKGLGSAFPAGSGPVITELLVMNPLTAPVWWSVLSCASCSLILLPEHMGHLTPVPLPSHTQTHTTPSDKWAVNLISLHSMRAHTRWKATESTERLWQERRWVGGGGDGHHNNRKSIAEVSISVLPLITMNVSLGPVISCPQSSLFLADGLFSSL
jgi:hypothetical protein